MNQYTKALIKEIEDYNFEPELYDLLAGHFIAKIHNQQLSDLVYKHAKKMPFDMILEFWQALEYPVMDIEEGCNISGFNAWYLKTYDKPVEEVSK